MLPAPPKTQHQRKENGQQGGQLASLWWQLPVGWPLGRLLRRWRPGTGPCEREGGGSWMGAGSCANQPFRSSRRHGRHLAIVKKIQENPPVTQGAPGGPAICGDLASHKFACSGRSDWSSRDPAGRASRFPALTRDSRRPRSNRCSFPGLYLSGGGLLRGRVAPPGRLDPVPAWPGCLP